MPVFNLRLCGDRSMNWILHFRATDRDVLKPEEIGRAIVSPPMGFQYRGVHADGAWNRFALETLVPLVVPRPPQGLSQQESLEALRKRQYRVIIFSDAPVQPDRSQNDGDKVNRKMKIRLVSNIPLNASRQQREEGCLVQLARLCGPQNLNLQIEGLGTTDWFPWMGEPCILSWNEVDLSWEGEAKITFQNRQLGVFENAGTLVIGLFSITSKMEVDGVRNVLRIKYSSPGDNWMLQKRLLERGTNSDLVISSSNPRNKKKPKIFKCHRDKLVEASQVFADMLQDNSEEAQGRTIKLPESEGVIEAMLHFIYYKGTDRIYSPRNDLVLELLKAAHKYNIDKLVDVAAFVVQTGNGMDSPWLSVETAMQTISFARNLDEKRCKELRPLREYCYEAVCVPEKWERRQSKSWRKLCGIAKKLGPGFEALLQNLQPNKAGKYIRKLLPGSLDGVEELEREEVKLFYNFLMSSGSSFVTCDAVVGIFRLGKHLGRSDQEMEEEVEKKAKAIMQDEDTNWPLRYYQVDYLVELFCLALKIKGKFWMDMKVEAVRKLMEYQTKQEKKIKASTKFEEMILGNAEVREAFEKLKEAMELEGVGQPKSKKRRRN